MRRILPCAAFVLFVFAAGCGDAPPPGFALDGKEFQADERLVVAGQPDEARLAAIRAAGFEVLISINPQAKAPPFDEAVVAKRVGLQYRHVPVSKETILDPKVRAQAFALLDEVEVAKEKTWFHCSTANRSAAIWALYLAERRGVPAEEALAAGRAVGLTKLEPAVRKLLGLPAE